MKKIICKIFWHFYWKTEWEVIIDKPPIKTSNYKETCKCCWHINKWWMTQIY